MNFLKKLNASILVAGDSILDVFLYGKSHRLSQEAPVPVVLVDNIKTTPGGACNVASNISDLGCVSELISYIGNDSNGKKLVNLLSSKQISINNSVLSDMVVTTTKTRVVSNDQHVVRYDQEQNINDSEIFKIMKNNIENISFSIFDGLIISDYNKGFSNERIIDTLKYKFKNKKIFVDPKPSNIEMYKGVYCITPNLSEARQMSKYCDVKDMSLDLKNRLNIDVIIITMSEKGIVVLDDKENFYEIDAHICSNIKYERHHRIDVTGAGDAIISAFACSICSGIDVQKSSMLSNIAASIVVNKLGTATCSFSELCREVNNK